MLEGLILRGKFVGEKIVEFKRKNGELGKSKIVSVLPKDHIETMSIEVDMDFKVQPDKEGRIEIPARPTAYCGTCKKFLATNLKMLTT